MSPTVYIHMAPILTVHHELIQLMQPRKSKFYMAPWNGTTVSRSKLHTETCIPLRRRHQGADNRTTKSDAFFFTVSCHFLRDFMKLFLKSALPKHFWWRGEKIQLQTCIGFWTLSDESFGHQRCEITALSVKNCGVVTLQLRGSGDPLSRVRKLGFRCLTYTF